MPDDLSSAISSQSTSLVAPFLIMEDKNLRRGNQEAIEFASVLHLAGRMDSSIPISLIVRVHWPFWLAGINRTIHLIDGLGNLVSSEIFPSLPYLNKIEAELGSSNPPRTLYEFRSRLERLSAWSATEEEEEAFVDFKIPSPGISRALTYFLAESKEQSVSGYRLRPKITSHDALGISRSVRGILTKGMLTRVQEATLIVQQEVDKWQKKGEEILNDLRDRFRDRMGKLMTKSRTKVRELNEKKRSEIEDANKSLTVPEIPNAPHREIQNLVKQIEAHLQGFRRIDKSHDYELVIDSLINLVFDFQESSRELTFVLGDYLDSLIQAKVRYAKSKQEILTKIEKVHTKYEKQIVKYTRGEDLIKDDESEKIRQGQQTIAEVEALSNSVLRVLDDYRHQEEERAEQLREWYLVPTARFPKGIRPPSGEVRLVYVPVYVIQWHGRMISPLIIYPTIIRRAKGGEIEFVPLEESEYIDLSQFLSRPRLDNNNLLWTRGDQVLTLLDEGLDLLGRSLGTDRIDYLKQLAIDSLEAFESEISPIKTE